jgi:hypothetical protein
MLNRNLIYNIYYILVVIVSHNLKDVYIVIRVKAFNR